MSLAEQLQFWMDEAKRTRETVESQRMEIRGLREDLSHVKNQMIKDMKKMGEYMDYEVEPSGPQREEFKTFVLDLNRKYDLGLTP